MTRAERLTQALEESRADVFISAIRPNQLCYRIRASSVLSCKPVRSFLAGEPIVFPGVWISCLSRPVNGLPVIENMPGIPRQRNSFSPICVKWVLTE